MQTILLLGTVAAIAVVSFVCGYSLNRGCFLSKKPFYKPPTKAIKHAFYPDGKFRISVLIEGKWADFKVSDIRDAMKEHKENKDLLDYFLKN